MEYRDTYTGYPMRMNYNQTKIPSPMNLRFYEPTTTTTTMLPLGGFAWPPRSYTCSFCKREFRSAQALGGHMNVHRRDRARVLNLSDAPAGIDDGKLVESKLVLSIRPRSKCSVVVDEDTAIVQCKRYKVSDHEIDLELRLGSDPQLVR